MQLAEPFLAAEKNSTELLNSMRPTLSPFFAALSEKIAEMIVATFLLLNFLLP